MVLTLAAAAVRMAWPTAPELVAGAVFIGLGCAGGLALSLFGYHEVFHVYVCAAAACQYAAIAWFVG